MKVLSQLAAGLTRIGLVSNRRCRVHPSTDAQGLGQSRVSAYVANMIEGLHCRWVYEMQPGHEADFVRVLNCPAPKTAKQGKLGDTVFHTTLIEQ